MRIWTTALLALAFAGEAAAAGNYASHPATTSQACARLCADDGLCVAWSLTADGACQLRATAPETPTGIASGYSQRAPASLRQAFVNPTPPTPAAAPARTETAQTEAPPPAPAADTDDGELLGGLDVRAEAPELRLGLRN